VPEKTDNAVEEDAIKPIEVMISTISKQELMLN
jgi:hypothetical protein